MFFCVFVNFENVTKKIELLLFPSVQLINLN